MLFLRVRVVGVLLLLEVCAVLAHAEPTADSVRTLSLELGLAPAPLAALGMSAESTQSALERLRSADDEIASLRSAQSQLASTLQSIESKQRMIRASADSSDVQQLQNEIDSLRAQAGGLSATVESLRTALIAEFLPDPLEGPAALRFCLPGEGMDQLPVEYRALDLAPDAAKELAAALASVRRASARGDTPDPAAAQLVAQYENRAEVALARGRMEANLPTIQQLFFIWQ